jgi:hypothetical protein
MSVAAVVLRLRFWGAQKREHELVQVVEEKTADLCRANEELTRLLFTDPLTDWPTGAYLTSCSIGNAPA